jgi:hypothetical protein
MHKQGFSTATGINIWAEFDEKHPSTSKLGQIFLAKIWLDNQTGAKLSEKLLQILSQE